MTSREFTEWVALITLEHEEELAREVKRQAERGLQKQRARPARKA